MTDTCITCPICQTQLLGKDAEQAELHVNGCLDVLVLAEKKHKRRTAAKSAATQQTVKTEKTEPRVMPTALEMLREIEHTALDSPIVHEASGPVYSKRTGLAPQQRSVRPLPDYKRMPFTSFTVDAFKYGAIELCTAYFLTHFHSDHYGGLTRSFSGHIYCSRITAKCVVQKLGVPLELVHALPMNTRCNVHGVYVTFIDANHCPGAVVIVFEVPSENGVVRIVHTGDFRASQEHVEQILRIVAIDTQKAVLPEHVMGVQATPRISPVIDFLYLDTTYLQPSYVFPCQADVVRAVVEFCSKVHNDPSFLPSFGQHAKPKLRISPITRWFPSRTPSVRKRRVLFVVGSYTIGKERLFIEIAQRLGARIFVSPAKRRMLECLGSSQLVQMLAPDMSAQVHVVEMSKVNMRGMAEHLACAQKYGFSSVVAFSPTGWAHSGMHYGARPEPRGPDPLDPGLMAPESHGLQSSDPDLMAPSESHADFERTAQLLAQAACMHGDSTFTLDNLKPRGSSSTVTIFPVPYSEHSSFAELARFVCSLKATRIIPTVFSSAAINDAAARWLRHWQTINIHFEGWARAADANIPPAHHPTLGLRDCKNIV
ncbi:repair protein PSO2 SNM1 [Coemansia sp. RSA 1822]|nr:repair protein PSO2 SNM1 [Coemansia sp. RSA 1822]